MNGQAAGGTGGRTADGEGLDLFRRACEAGDPAAWEALVTRYRGLVLDWVRRSLRGPLYQEHQDDWVTRTFERFWLAVAPGGSHFRDLPAALQYLKLCARSVVLDEARARQAVALEPLEDLDEWRILGAPGGTPGGSPAVPDVESVVFGRLAAGDLWQAVLDALPDRDERLVAHLSFVQGLKPAEIAAAHPERFATTTDVYRIKRNTMERLRRSPRLLARWRPEAPPVLPARTMAIAA